MSKESDQKPLTVSEVAQALETVRRFSGLVTGPDALRAFSQVESELEAAVNDELNPMAHGWWARLRGVKTLARALRSPYDQPLLPSQNLTISIDNPPPINEAEILVPGIETVISKEGWRAFQPDYENDYQTDGLMHEVYVYGARGTSHEFLHLDTYSGVDPKGPYNTYINLYTIGFIYPDYRLKLGIWDIQNRKPVQRQSWFLKTELVHAQHIGHFGIKNVMGEREIIFKFALPEEQNQTKVELTRVKIQTPGNLIL